MVLGNTDRSTWWLSSAHSQCRFHLKIAFGDFSVLCETSQCTISNHYNFDSSERSLWLWVWKYVAGSTAFPHILPGNGCSRGLTSFCRWESCQSDASRLEAFFQGPSRRRATWPGMGWLALAEGALGCPVGAPRVSLQDGWQSVLMGRHSGVNPSPQLWVSWQCSMVLEGLPWCLVLWNCAGRKQFRCYWSFGQAAAPFDLDSCA